MIRKLLPLLILLAGTFGSLVAGPIPEGKPERYPDWWFARGVVPYRGGPSLDPKYQDYNQADDKAVANAGQLKHLAIKAAEELDEALPGGAGPEIHALLRKWETPSSTRDDFSALNQRQVKAVASLFYKRLKAAKYMGPPRYGNPLRYGDPSEPITNYYPWGHTGSPADDLAVANLGQLKQVFCFDPARFLFRPDSIPDLRLWLDAQSLVASDGAPLADGTKIAQWSDSSGNGNHAIQPDSDTDSTPAVDYRPTFLASGPAVNFNAATKQHLTVAQTPRLDVDGTKGITVIAIARRNTSTLHTDRMVVAEKGDYNANPGLGYSLNFLNSSQAVAYILKDGAVGPAAEGPFHALVSIYDNVNNRLYVDGALVDTSPYDGPIAPRNASLTIGGRLATFNLHGDIAELLIYARALTDPERREVESYLRKKYGVGAQPIAPPPVFNIKTGTYAETQFVTLECPALPGAVIRYTTNGTDPTANSTIYSAAISVSAAGSPLRTTTTLKARAFKYGFNSSTDASLATSTITIDPATSLISRNGLLLWLNAASFAGTPNSTPISAWPDQSGNAYVASQTVPGNQPMYGTLDGRSYLAFDNLGDYLVIPHSSALSPQQVSIFAVVERSVVTTAARIVEKYSGGGYSLLMTNDGTDRVQFYANSTPVEHSVPSSATGLHFLAAIYDQAQRYLNVNGGMATQVGLTTLGAPLGAPTTPLYIGGRAAADTFRGKIYEIIVYNRGVSVAERQDLERYIYMKYEVGTQPVLPKPEFNLKSITYKDAQTLTISPPSGHTGVTLEYTVTLNGIIGSSKTYPLPPLPTVPIPLVLPDSLPASRTTNVYTVTATAKKSDFTDSTNTVTIAIDPLADVPRDGLELWLKADSLLLANLDPVTRWADQSGKGNDAVQATLTLQPTYTDRTAGAPAAVTFDATRVDRLIVNNVPGLNPANITIFAIANLAGSFTAPDTILAKGSVYSLEFSGTGAAPFIGGAINNKPVVTPSTTGAFHALCLAYDGKTKKVYYDGNTLVSKDYTDPMPVTNNAPLTIGADGAAAGLAGSIAEILVYGRALSNIELLALQAYAHKKYGVGQMPKAEPPTSSSGEVVFVTNDTTTLELFAAPGATISYAEVVSGIPPVWKIYDPLSPPLISKTADYLCVAALPDHLNSDEIIVKVLKDNAANEVAGLGPKVWLRADAAKTSLGKVTSWPSLVPGGVGDVAQTDTSKQPTLLAAVIDGKPAVSFDGISDCLVGGGNLYCSSGAAFAVVKYRRANGYQNIFGDIGAPLDGGCTMFFYAGSVNLEILGTVAGPQGPYAGKARRPATCIKDTYSVVTGAWSSSLSAVLSGDSPESLGAIDTYVNFVKSQEGYTLRSFTEQAAPFTVGALSSSNFPLDGEIAELILFDRRPSVKELRQVQAYLNGRYRITFPSLPPELRPTFIPPTGTYVKAQSVEIEANADTMSIYYDTTGADPFSFDSYGHPSLKSGASLFDDAIPVNVDPDHPEVPITVRFVARAAYLTQSGAMDSDRYSEPSSAIITIDPSTAKVNRKGLKLWLRADSLGLAGRPAGLADGSTVTEWLDQSGSGNHAQGETGSSPHFILQNLDLGGKPSVRFGVGAVTFLRIPDSASSLNLSEVSIVAIAKRSANNDGTPPKWLLSKSDIYNGYALGMDNLQKVRYSLNVNNDADATALLSPAEQTKFNLLVGTYDRVYNKIYINGVLADPVAAGSAIADYAQDLTIGDAGTGAALTADIAEIMVYDHALGQAERDGIQDYVFWKYGVGTPAAVDSPVFMKEGVVYSGGAGSSAPLISLTGRGSIYYTLDGSEPSSASTSYIPLPAGGPILPISTSTTIKAIAVVKKVVDGTDVVIGVSPVSTLTYIRTSEPTPYQTDTDLDGIPNAVDGGAYETNGEKRTYKYDPLHQLTDDGVQTYQHDAEGNVSH